MYYTGFADEAGGDIATQIRATKELGWSHIESRNIDGKNIHDMAEADFDAVCQALADADVKINCFGSAVANWGKDVRKPEDVAASVEALKRALPRMKTLGCTMIRGMSFAIARDARPDSPELEALIFENVRTLVKLCEDAGVLYVHENCMNYGGLSHKHTLKLVENVNSDNFKLVFDTGNPVMTWDHSQGGEPTQKQNAWNFYSAVKPFVHYIHIKDGTYVGESEGIFPNMEFTMPGEGDGCVKEIVTDLLKSGYDGGISIEPHLSVVFHDPGEKDNADAAARIRYENYVEYGKRLMAIVEEAKAG